MYAAPAEETSLATTGITPSHALTFFIGRIIVIALKTDPGRGASRGVRQAGMGAAPAVPSRKRCTGRLGVGRPTLLGGSAGRPAGRGLDEGGPKPAGSGCARRVLSRPGRTAPETGNRRGESAGRRPRFVRFQLAQFAQDKKRKEARPQLKDSASSGAPFLRLPRKDVGCRAFPAPLKQQGR